MRRFKQVWVLLVGMLFVGLLAGVVLCHDHSGSYLKGRAGNPRKGVDLLAAAKSVGNPQRDNCGVCHNYGGGGSR